MPYGEVASWDGLQPADRLNDIQSILEMLSRRTWSPEHRGLQCWAGALDCPHRPCPVIVFAIGNCSDAALSCLPRAPEGGICITARRSDGRLFESAPARWRTRGLPYREIGAGETMYVHPAYGFIPPDSELGLPPGE